MVWLVASASPSDAGERYSTSGSPIAVEASPLPGWPVKLEGGTPTATFEVMDLEGTRAVVTPHLNAIDLLDPAAFNLAGWPVLVTGGTAACLADIDGDGEQEIFVGGFQEYHGFRLDGRPLPGWPNSASNFGGSLNFATAPCAIADLEGDGTFEIVGGTNFGEVSVWRQDGTLLNGWPRRLPSPDQLGVSSVFGAPSFGDLDQDGILEIVLTSANGRLHVFRPDGTNFPGFPISLGLGPIFADPAIADVNGDGIPEIIVLYAGLGPGTRMVVFRADGSILHAGALSDGVKDGPAIADLDRDGELWIIAGVDSFTETLMVWNARTGAPRPGFPIANTRGAKGVFTAPTVGDITGDGFPDIMLERFFDNGIGPALFAWDRFGNPITGRALQGIFVGGVAPTLADLNGDGLVDVLPTDQSFTSGHLHALTFNTPYDARTMEWPTDSHDVRHTGFYTPPVDALRMWGKMTPPTTFLGRPQPVLKARLRLVDTRRDLAAALLAGGVQITEINDRAIPPIPGRIVAKFGESSGGAKIDSWDLEVEFDGATLGAAILARLRKAGLSGVNRRQVRLKVATPTVDRRLVAGEVRLTVITPP